MKGAKDAKGAGKGSTTARNDCVASFFGSPPPPAKSVTKRPLDSGGESVKTQPKTEKVFVGAGFGEDSSEKCAGGVPPVMWHQREDPFSSVHGMFVEKAD